MSPNQWNESEVFVQAGSLHVLVDPVEIRGHTHEEALPLTDCSGAYAIDTEGRSTHQGVHGSPRVTETGRLREAIRCGTYDFSRVIRCRTVCPRSLLEHSLSQSGWVRGGVTQKLGAHSASGQHLLLVALHAGGQQSVLIHRCVQFQKGDVVRCVVVHKVLVHCDTIYSQVRVGVVVVEVHPDLCEVEERAPFWNASPTS